MQETIPPIGRNKYEKGLPERTSAMISPERVSRVNPANTAHNPTDAAARMRGLTPRVSRSKRLSRYINQLIRQNTSCQSRSTYCWEHQSWALVCCRDYRRHVR